MIQDCHALLFTPLFTVQYTDGNPSTQHFDAVVTGILGSPKPDRQARIVNVPSCFIYYVCFACKSRTTFVSVDNTKLLDS